MTRNDSSFISTIITSTLCLCACRYDPKTDTWTLVAPISTPRDAVGVCLLGDRLYAVGGYDGQQYLSEVEGYDPQANEWTKVGVISMEIYSFKLR